MTVHRTLVYTYSRAFDGPRWGAWWCSCGLGTVDMPNARTATSDARRHVTAQGGRL